MIADTLIKLAFTQIDSWSVILCWYTYYKLTDGVLYYVGILM